MPSRRRCPILILDEPSSGLDVESERLVFKGFYRLHSGKTTFAISHRSATIRNSDVILVLDQGRIVERGTHDQLLAQNGLCSRLQQLQRTEDVQTAESLKGVGVNHAGLDSLPQSATEFRSGRKT